MVDLPKVQRRLVTTEEPRSGLTAADIASPYGSMAKAIHDVGDAASAVAEKAAPDAAAQAVVTDANGNVTVERTSIPMVGRAGQIYEQHIRTGAVAAADASADRALIDMRAETRGDPGTFLTAATEFRDKFISEYTPIIGPAGAAALRRQIDNRITQTYSGLTSERQNKEIARANDALSARSTTMANEMELLAASDGIGSDDYRERLGNFRAILDQRVNAPNSTYSREHANLELSQLQARLETAAIHGRVERALEGRDGVDRAMQIAETVRSDKSLNLTLQQRQQAYARALTAVNAKVRQATAVATAINGEIDAIDTIAATGNLPSADRIAALRTRAADANNPEVARAADAALANLPIVASWHQMSPAQLEGELSRVETQMRERGADERSIALLKTGRTLLENMRKGITNNPLGWANQTGTVSVPPIDFAGENAGAEMRNRIAVADVVAQTYGGPKTYLLPEEKRALEAATASGAAPMQQVAQLIVNGFGSRAPDVLREVGQQSPVLAHMGGLLSGNLFGGGSPAFANDVAAGAALLRNEETRKQLPPWARQPSNTVARFETGRQVEQYGDAFLLVPDTARAAGQSAQAAFIARAQRQGFDPSVTDPSDPTRKAYDRALQEGAGATFTADNTQFGGVVSYKSGTFGFRATNHVLVPGNVRTDSFRDVITKIRDDDLSRLPISPMTADGKVYTARDIQKALPVAVPGGYRFSMGDPASADPKWVRGADGRPFVLDFEAMSPVLRGRVPGAFTGER